MLQARMQSGSTYYT